MNHNKINIRIPEESNVYRTLNVGVYVTPLGSQLSPNHFFYKHTILQGLETEIQHNLKGLRYE